MSKQKPHFRQGKSDGPGPSSRSPRPFQNRDSITPVSLTPRIFKGLLQFNKGTETSYESLLSMMREKNESSVRYRSGAFAMVEKAYSLAREKYRGHFRRSREGGFLGIGATRPEAITHPLIMAMRAARFGQSKEAICACLLHDVIEDYAVKPGDILKLFGGKEVSESPGDSGVPGASPKSAKRVLELVLLLTKPKLSTGGKWVYPNNPDFYDIKNEFRDADYDMRAEEYYHSLLRSGDMDAIFIKILDNIQNAESMKGVPDAWRQRNMRTMLRYTMKCAFAILPAEDAEYVRSLFTKWDFRIPEQEVERPAPKDGIVILPSRASGFDPAVWALHPNPTSGLFLTVYWDLYSKMAGSCEVGFPPGIITEPASLLRRYLDADGIDQLLVTQGKSLVPNSLPVYEEILIVSGFGPASRFIRPSETPGKISILNASFKPIMDISASAIGEKTFTPSENLAVAIRNVEKEFSFFLTSLRKLFHEQIAPHITPPVSRE
jgi:hypothetical protein